MKTLLSLLRVFPGSAILAVCLLLTGCASSTSLMLGNPRAARSADEVRVYAEAPAGAEVIGLVRARTLLGLGEQGQLNAALKELRAEAGRLGANGVVVTRTDESPLLLAGAHGKSTGTAVPINTPVIEGRAIFVAE